MTTVAAETNSDTQLIRVDTEAQRDLTAVASTHWIPTLVALRNDGLQEAVAAQREGAA